MKNFVLIIISLLLTSTASLAQSQDVEIITTSIHGNIYMLEGKGGNIGVSIGDDGVLIVDDQFADLYTKIQTAINALNNTGVKYVLNTHYHGDHTGGNEEMSQSGATIIAHENVRKRLSTEHFRTLMNQTIEPKTESFWPVITFDRSVTLYFNGERIDVIHFPTGHTDGDSVVYFRNSNVIHMGDHFFNGDFPFIDVDAGGDVDGYIENVKKILFQVTDDTQIIPGHGKLATKQDLVKFVVMLEEASKLIRQAIADGKTLQEAQKSALPEEMTKKWGNGFMNPETWIKIVYTNYKK